MSYVEGSEKRDEAAERADADGLTGRNGRAYMRKEERENQAVLTYFLTSICGKIVTSEMDRDGRTPSQNTQNCYSI